MQRHASVLLATLLAGVAAARETGTTVSAPEAGFELTIPDVGWTHREQRGDDGLSAVAIGPVAEGGLVQLSIQVTTVSDSGVDAARSHLRALRAALGGDASILEVEDMQLEVAGHEAPGLDLVQAAYGQEFRVHLVLFRARGFQYRIQFHAPRDRFDEQWTIAQRVLDGFELIDLDPAAQERVRLQALAGRCGSQVAWAADWEEAARLARTRGRLVVVAVFAQPGFALGNTLDEVVFMSPEIIALMEHRFVGWRWSAGEAAPFVDHGVFGLSGSTFGVGLLVCTPDGRVVRQIFVPTPELVADGLRASLRGHPELAPPPDPPEASRAEQAAFLIDSGRLEAARVALRAEPEDDELRAVAHQRARLARIERDGPAALDALEAADRARTIDAEPPRAVLLLEEATVQIGLGRNDLAADALQRCLASEPEPEQRAQALLLQGALSWADADKDLARAQLTALTREHPEQPAAWIAAAGLLGPALEIDITPNLSWPTESAAHMAVLPAPAAPDSTFEVPSALADAVDFLVNAQLADGRWEVPFSARHDHPAPHRIAMASQAICTLGLARAADGLDGREPDRATRCRDAARRGLQRYLDDRGLERAHPRPVAFMDYTCWASSYGLLCLAAILDPGTGLTAPMSESDRAEIEAEAARLVGDLASIQAPNGGWSYYVSGDVGGTSPGAAMSFTTATVLLALHAARDRGLDVPGETLDRGQACLASLRGTNGPFEYMRIGTEPHEAGEVHPSGAAARGPVCTLALQRGGLLEAESMEQAVLLYVEHLGDFGAEARKALMHAGPAGQGSHYLLYDYSTAAEALRATDDGAIDPATRDLARAAILRELARCRNADGSFVDNPLIGCAPGTGLAVLTLLDLMLDPAAAPDR